MGVENKKHMNKRPNEITAEFMAILDRHLEDIIAGKSDTY